MEMSSDESTDLLLGLGLSLNQARVYLAVLKLEKTTVAQVAKYSKVRREDVYRILPSLEKMGLIERLLGKPTEIRATPISDALSLLVSEEKNKSDDRLTGMRSSVKRLSLKGLEATASWGRKHLHTDSREKSNFGKNFRTN